ARPRRHASGLRGRDRLRPAARGHRGAAAVERRRPRRGRAAPAAADQPLGAAGVVRARALHHRSQLGVRVPATLRGGAGSDGGPRLVLRRLSRVADPLARAAARRVGPPGTPAREPVCHVGGRARLRDHRAAADAAVADTRRPRAGERQRPALSTLAALVVERAPERERGLALGTLSGAWDLGVVVGSVLLGAVADHFSYATGFAVGSVFAALGVCALALTATRRPLTEPVPNA